MSKCYPLRWGWDEGTLDGDGTDQTHIQLVSDWDRHNLPPSQSTTRSTEPAYCGCPVPSLQITTPSWLNMNKSPSFCNWTDAGYPVFCTKRCVPDAHSARSLASSVRYNTRLPSVCRISLVWLVADQRVWPRSRTPLGGRYSRKLLSVMLDRQASSLPNRRTSHPFWQASISLGRWPSAQPYNESLWNCSPGQSDSRSPPPQ